MFLYIRIWWNTQPCIFPTSFICKFHMGLIINCRATITTYHHHNQEQKQTTETIIKKIIIIKQYQKKWLQHVQRMDTNRLPKHALQYKPKGRRNIGRPRKRWRDQIHLEDQGTGKMPNPSRTWWWWIITSSYKTLST